MVNQCGRVFLIYAAEYFLYIYIYIPTYILSVFPGFILNEKIKEVVLPQVLHYFAERIVIVIYQFKILVIV